MKYLSLFSGIGGFEKGIQQAYEELYNLRPNELANNQRPKEQYSTSDKLQQWECVGYSEIDKYAVQIYEKQFNHKNYGDITKIIPNELPDFDCLVGGFPCQSFSIAGKRLGFDDTRGTLFFDIARILADKRPRNLVLENVKGLLSHDKGKTFTTILGVLTDLGYFVEWQVLNSKNFGVPQNRERVFIIGHLGGEPGRKVFPITENSGQTNKEMTKIEVKPVLTPDRPIKRQNGRRIKENGEPSFTLTGQDKHGVMVDTRIRRLTPMECERLQGFPDGWTEGLSDTQRYKTLGNAVTVNVIEYIFSKLL